MYKHAIKPNMYFLFRLEQIVVLINETHGDKSLIYCILYQTKGHITIPYKKWANGRFVDRPCLNVCVKDNEAEYTAVSDVS